MTSTYQTILIEIDDRGIATMTLNRPEKHNAMSSEMMAEIRHAIATIHADNSIRAVVLTGAGRSFCAGADLGWMKANFDRNRQERIAESEVLGAMLDEMNRLNKPLIAKVNGQAYAGGIGMISVCDIAIGVPDAMFSVTEVRLGLTPANISPYLIARMGISNARRTFLNAHFFKGEEAVTLGLLNKVVDAEQLQQAVDNEIKELLSCAPEAVAITKELIRYVTSHQPEDVRLHTSALLADCWEGEEAQSGIQAFFEKKPAPWIN